MHRFRLVKILALLTVGINWLTSCAAFNLSPVILLPGFTNSKLESRWSSEQASLQNCRELLTWQTVWLNAGQVSLDCGLKSLELIYNRTTNRSQGRAGVELRVKDEWKLDSIEYFRPIKGLEGFGRLTKRLVEDLNYTRDVNLRGAPYDWRLAPDELEHYYEGLKAMVEELFAQSDGTRVTLISHSMGCLNALVFLQKQPKIWKEKYIRRLVTLGAPWGGSVNALRIVLLGMVQNFRIVDPKILGNLARSLPASYFLLPNQRVYGTQPLVVTNLDGESMREFTASDLASLFDLIPELRMVGADELWRRTRDLTNNLAAPHVELHCFYGEGHNTLSNLKFTGEPVQSEEIEYFDDGDNLVSVRSASFCQTWKAAQQQPIEARGFHTSHIGLIREDQVLGELIKILSS